MGLLLLWFFDLLIIMYGLWRLRQGIRQQELPALFLLADEEEYLEDLLRYTVGRMKKGGVPNRLVFLYEAEDIQTARAAAILAGKLSFITVDTGLRGNGRRHLLDLRGMGSSREKYGLINEFLERRPLNMRA